MIQRPYTFIARVIDKLLVRLEEETITQPVWCVIDYNQLVGNKFEQLSVKYELDDYRDMITLLKKFQVEYPESVILSIHLNLCNPDLF